MTSARRSLVAALFVLLSAGAARAPIRAPVATPWPTPQWAVTGADRANFAISDLSADGRAMSFRRVSPGTGFGATVAAAEPADYRGKRIRLTVELRAENAVPGATAWLRIDGDSGRMLALENNSTRPVTGTSGWTTQVTELDVTADARRIMYGVILLQDGTVHVRNVQLTVVDPKDEALAWRTDLVGGSSPFYEVVDTSDAGHSLTLRRMDGGTLMENEFGTATTSMPASAFKGSRVVVRAMVRTKDAAAAGIWVRAEGGGKTLALQNNMAQPIVGTTQWTGQKAILDVPAGTERIAYGLLLIGRGAIVVRDVAVSAEPVTGAPMPGVQMPQ